MSNFSLDESWFATRTITPRTVPADSSVGCAGIFILFVLVTALLTIFMRSVGL
jgi:hypothetical protein